LTRRQFSLCFARPPCLFSMVLKQSVAWALIWLAQGSRPWVRGCVFRKIALWLQKIALDNRKLHCDNTKLHCGYRKLHCDNTKLHSDYRKLNCDLGLTTLKRTNRSRVILWCILLTDPNNSAIFWYHRAIFCYNFEPMEVQLERLIALKTKQTWRPR
jgi:hypothetical protein